MSSAGQANATSGVARRVLITGVGSGLGLALAEHYLSIGWQVLSLGRSHPTSLAAHAGSCHVAVDFAEPEAVSAACAELLAGQGALDLAILNAGVLPEMADMADTSLVTIRGVMDINTWAHKSVLDTIYRLGCPLHQVVAISSGAAVRGNRGWNGYALSKAALNMLMQLYARERPETHYISLAPGLVDSGMQDYLCSRSQADLEKFPSLQRIQAARGTEQMPTPAALAPKLVELMPALRDYESGIFVDIRRLPAKG